ncbi:MAG: hypothetical protein ACRDJ3_02530 [Solirubrobacteraceae bacterium]
MICMFCGENRKPTREHVFPQWLARFVGDDAGIDTYLWKLGASPVERGPYLNRLLTDLVLRKVCAPCNSGWMSELETEARPLLIDLIAGRVITLNSQVRAVLLRWALKTAAALGPIQKAPDAVGVGFRRALAKGNDLGALVSLWAASADAADVSTPHWRVGCDLGDHAAPVLNITGILLGSIVIEVVCLNRPDILPADQVPPLTPRYFQYVAPSDEVDLHQLPSNPMDRRVRFSERPAQIARRLVEEGLSEAPASSL